jgi:hypothetical protein
MDERLLVVAAAQLSVLVHEGVLAPTLQDRSLGSGTPVHDLNGAVLFERVVVGESYVDLAVAPELGAPVVAVTEQARWEPELLVEQATAALRRRRKKADYDETRFVAYSFPKLAVQFLRGGQQVALIECYTGAEVPVAQLGRGEKATPPGNFEAWSFLDQLPAAERRRRVKRFDETVVSVSRFLDEANDVSPTILSERGFLERIRSLVDTRQLHYSGRDTDHACYELRGQETNVWCVGASVQMMLDFYRYDYTQDRLAAELGLGTRANPSGLPYSRDGDVVTVLDNMTGKALTASMNTAPTFAEYRAEIRANRPLISFVPGHSRSVAGYVQNRVAIIPSLGFQGLLVYDPWPPNAGVITRWENYNATTYRRTFTARVTLA